MYMYMYIYVYIYISKYDIGVWKDDFLNFFHRCAMKTHDMFVELGQEKTIPFMVTVAILGIVHTDIGKMKEVLIV